MAQSERSAAISRKDDYVREKEHRGQQERSHEVSIRKRARIRLLHAHLTPSQRPHEMLPKLFGPLRARYAERPGGYTRVLRLEPIKEDQAPSAILELVDGPKDMRFALTAKTIAAVRRKGHDINDMTAANIQKVTRYRQNADEELEEMVQKFSRLAEEGDEGVDEVVKKRVYPANERSR